MTETEVKIRIGDPRPMREKLLALGAVVCRDRLLEEDTLYDFPGARLASRAAGAPAAPGRTAGRP